MTPQEFIAKFGPMMVSATKGTGVFPSVGIAQAALETGWGKSYAANANNAFGIKATGKPTPYWDGSYVVATGWEEGQAPTSMKWRKYKSVEDSVKDYVYLLTHNERYAEALKAKTPEEQIKATWEAGYATAANYVETIIKIINQHGLKQLDKKKA